ncbi:MAG TPA: phosphoglycolate phosphatase [Prevotellaceae bacterium]|nr:phosphoglycolate phosphatase [Prevotellaceae bacterium]HBE55100.1 phosphoglycolate phosphatase [Prevotellaceae bacterium]
MTDTLFFDLDGTLVDSGDGIMKTVRHTLARFGIQVEDWQQLRPFVGPPLEDSFRDFYGFGERQAQEAVEVYREEFARQGIFDQRLYPGVCDFLDEVRRRGYATALATSKMDFQAVQVTGEIFPQLGRRLDRVFARDSAGTLHTKADVIRYGLRQMDISEPERVLMVGDRKFDVQGAKSCGLHSAGVLFGFGDYGELEAAGATYICSSYAELLDLLPAIA